MTARPRDIKQFAVTPEDTEHYGRIYALAFDGSLWYMKHGGRNNWERLPDLPPADSWHPPPLPVTEKPE